MNKCLNCIYFNPSNGECDNEEWEKTHCRFDKPEPCEHFVKRKFCSHRFENCDMNGCDVICHKCPSDHGCYFYYWCDLDDSPCYENCRSHELRHKLEQEREKLHKMFETKKFMEKMIEETQLKIEKLEKEYERKEK